MYQQRQQPLPKEASLKGQTERTVEVAEALLRVFPHLATGLVKPSVANRLRLSVVG